MDNDWIRFGQQLLQEGGMRVAKRIAKDPKAAIAIGIAVAKTAGEIALTASPYMVPIMVGAALILNNKKPGNSNNPGGTPPPPPARALLIR